MTFKRTGRRKTPRAAHESPFNPRPGFRPASEPALRSAIGGKREVPPPPSWMRKPLRPLNGLVKP